MRGRQRLEGTTGFVACDTRHLPIVVARWSGTVDLELVAAFDQWLGLLLDQLEQQQLRATFVADITGTEPPNSDVRRALVSVRSGKLPRTRERFVSDFVVIDRPALRGVIKALHWIAPQLQATPAASLDEALQRCQQALAREGIAAPLLSAFEFE